MSQYKIESGAENYIFRGVSVPIFLTKRSIRLAVSGFGS